MKKVLTLIVIVVLLCGCISTQEENKKPKAVAYSSKLSPYVGEDVIFDAKGSNDPDGKIVKYEWDFDGDGKFDYSSKVVGRTVHKYMKGGKFNVTLRVTDNKGATATAHIVITVRDYENFTISSLLQNSEKNEGSLVHIVSVVVEIGNYKKYGPQITKTALFYVADDWNKEKITVFLESNTTRPLNLTTGSIVDVWGVFLKYKDKWEIKVRSETLDRVVVVGESPLPYYRLKISELLSEPEKFNGTRVTLENVIVMDEGNYNMNGSNEDRGVKFYVADDWYGMEIQVYSVAHSRRPDIIKVGDLLNIKGIFTRYKNEWEVKVRDYEDDIIEVNGSSEPVYEKYTVNDLLKNPENYENRFVDILAVVVSPGNLIGNVSEPENYLIFDVADDWKCMSVITVYVEANASRPTDMSTESYLRIKGLFTKYKGDWEIKVRDNGFDSIELIGEIEKPYKKVTVREILSEPETYYGENIFLEKVKVVDVAKIWKFYVEDINGSEEIMVYAEKNSTLPLKIRIDDIIKIKGYFTKYNKTWEIKIRAYKNDSVEIIESPPTQYTKCSVMQLLDTPEDFNSTPIVIENGIVTSGKYRYLFYITDDSTETTKENITVYGADLDNIPAEGTIMKVKGLWINNKGIWEIKIRGYSDDIVEILGETYPHKNSTLKDVLSNTEKYKNSLIRIVGLKIIYINDNVMKVEDENGNNITVYSWEDLSSKYTLNQTVNVRGKFIYYSKGGYWEIYLRKGTKDAIED